MKAIEVTGKALRPGRPPAVSPLHAICIFVGAFCLLFLGMRLRPNMYDEGIVLTAAMRVAAGQVPHRDFYAIYGPAEFYGLAWLFRIFGESILIERVIDLALRAAIVVSVYWVAVQYCRKIVAGAAAGTALLWLFGVYYATPGAAVLPDLLLCFVATALLLPVFEEDISWRRSFAVGILIGLALLFRYDIGVAVFLIHAVILAMAVWIRCRDKKVTTFLSTLWPYALGFCLLTLPPALWYISVAPLKAFVHDIIFYPSHYYHRGRNLPFPRIHLKGWDDTVAYFLPVVFALSLYSLVFSQKDPDSAMEGRPDWRWVLLAFTPFAFLMYLKGYVRISGIQLLSSSIPSLLLIAVLFEQRHRFPSFLRGCIVFFAGFSVIPPVWASLREARDMHQQHDSMAGSIVAELRHSRPVLRQEWCKMKTPLTGEICFLPEDDRIEAIEFISEHTQPGQRIFVGTTKHDRIYTNDNLIYFAAQRLPATHWSHFDPDLQNRSDIQREMIQEFEKTTPPYMVLDAEFDNVHEPNDSALSSGVTLLDDYIRTHYRPVQRFGFFTIWQRDRAQAS